MISLYGSSFEARGRHGPYRTASLSSSWSSWPDAIQLYTVRRLTPTCRAIAALLIPCSKWCSGSTRVSIPIMASPPFGGDAMI